MSREISSTFKAAMLRDQTSEVVKVLLTLSHDDFDADLHFVNDIQALTSNGTEFIAFPFNIQLPSDDDDNPKASITIQNIDRKIGEEVLKLLVEPVEVKIQVVLASSPNTIEVEWTEFLLTDIQINDIQITGNLSVRDIAQEPFPSTVLTSLVAPIWFK